MAIEATSDLKKLDMKNINAISHAEPKRVQDLQKGNQLPTITEDQIEQDTIDFNKLGVKPVGRVPQSRQQSKRHPRVQSSVKTGAQVSSQRNNYQSDARNGVVPSSRLVSGH